MSSWLSWSTSATARRTTSETVGTSVSGKPPPYVRSSPPGSTYPESPPEPGGHQMTKLDHPLTDQSAAGTLTLGGELTVHRLGFGAMRITGSGIWGEPDDRAEALAVLRRAVELGVNLIDTADSYGPEVSENLIAEALHPYPGDLVIATKGGLVRPGPGSWEPDGRPEHLREACENSLRRLRLDRSDLHQPHTVDPTVPFGQ